MKYPALAATIVAVSLAALASTAGATTIINGSFEQGPNGSGFVELGGGSTAIPGWTVAGNSIDYITTYWQAADGSRSLDLSGSDSGSVFQTLATTAGQKYTVTFDMAGNPDGAPVTKELSVDAGAGTAQDYAFDTTGATHNAMGWTPETYTFTASGASTVLTFTDLNNGSPYGAALDNVAISVPEPATWAMMLLGVGLIGGGLRMARRKDSVALIQA